MAKVDIRRVEAIEDRANDAEDAYWEWESEQYEKLCAHDYDPDEHPVISHRNLTVYASRHRRSQQVTEASRLRTEIDG